MTEQSPTETIVRREGSARNALAQIIPVFFQVGYPGFAPAKGVGSQAPKQAKARMSAVACYLNAALKRSDGIADVIAAAVFKEALESG